MAKKKSKFKSYDEFEKSNSASTDRYEPPKYVVQPAKDDKGFAMFKAAFDSKKRKYTPGISWSFAK